MASRASQLHVIWKQSRNVYTIKLNRPEKKNALSTQMYEDIKTGLKNAASSSEVSVTVLTGTGDYFCAGADLKSAELGAGQDRLTKLEAGDRRKSLESFILALIDHPKPLVAVVNGSAVGIGVTMLALCDLVYTTDSAIFNTPFAMVGKLPEVCSTVLFPMLMGRSKAFEVLMGKKLTAKEAFERNLVTAVFPEHSFESESSNRIQELASLEMHSLLTTKRLVAQNLRPQMLKAMELECNALEEHLQSPRAIEGVKRFFRNKSKL